MHPGGGIIASGAAAGVTPIVSLNTSNVSQSTVIGTCYANLRYSSTGEEFQNSNAIVNNYTLSRGNWLDAGDPSDVWLERTINSGSLNLDPGGGRLIMTSNRSFQCIDTNPGAGGSQSANLDIEMWDAASGGSTFDSVAGLILSASYFDPCPLCCFPPDTMIWMADGTHRPIGGISAGEVLRIQNGIESVGEVIIREGRPMCKLTFADSRTLVLSVDHPIYAKGKGRACVQPESQYKGHMPEQLEVGDHALTEGGILIKLVGIESYDFPGKVYTFSNTRFFAGGVMVY